MSAKYATEHGFDKYPEHWHLFSSLKMEDVVIPGEVSKKFSTKVFFTLKIHNQFVIIIALVGSRLRCFDRIRPYNLYSRSKENHDGLVQLVGYVHKSKTFVRSADNVFFSNFRR